MTAIVRNIAISLIDIISLLLFLRAILSWFMGLGGNRFYEILCNVTDPFLYPFRALFDRIGIGQNCPIDLSFLATVIALQILGNLL